MLNLLSTADSKSRISYWLAISTFRIWEFILAVYKLLILKLIIYYYSKCSKLSWYEDDRKSLELYIGKVTLHTKSITLMLFFYRFCEISKRKFVKSFHQKEKNKVNIKDVCITNLSPVLNEWQMGPMMLYRSV